MITPKDPPQVYLKIKPNISQDQSPPDPLFHILNASSVSLDNKYFKFDYISDPCTSLFDFFSLTIVPMCDLFLSGTSLTILSYGQAGSGKTFTMYGDSKETGIVQRSCDYILKSASPCRLKCSFIEILQENLYDLLAPTVKGLSLTEDTRAKVSVDGLCEETLRNPGDAIEICKKIVKKVGGGKSHLIFTVALEGESHRKIVFVDLAGAERRKNSDSYSENMKKESTAVNRSLSALGNVIKGLSQKSEHIVFRESKLTYFLKDSLVNSKLVIVATMTPLRRCYWETLNTLKFAQKCKRINNEILSGENDETIENLLREIGELKSSIEVYQEFEKRYLGVAETNKTCQKRISELEERVSNLEDENKILRREIYEPNKIDNSDWLLSSDSEDQETSQISHREKREIDKNILELQKTIEVKSKLIKDMENKLGVCIKEKEECSAKYEELVNEIENAKKKCLTYQELSVLLSQQNSELISELSKTKEFTYDYIADFSSISSTDSSKCEIYKIMEEKDAKVYNLLENTKIAEDNLQRMKERYQEDIGKYKKLVAKLNSELSLCKSENFRENSEAMKVLDDLRQEKTKLLNIIANFNDNPDRRKILELKEMNLMLLDNLKIKGQQISELQKQFENFLNDRGYSSDLIKKLNNKTQKLRNFENEFCKIKSFLLKFSHYRNILEKMSISDCIIDILSSLQQKKTNRAYIEEQERLNFSHS